MASTLIYYQWQNEFLLQTIYPLRETKLRDFLYFFHEIDIWKKYKTLTPADIPGEIEDYCAAQRQKLNEAYTTYAELEAYFLNDRAEEISALYSARFPDLDQEVLKTITSIHRAFKQYFLNYKSPSSQKYFLSARVRAGEELRKNVLWKISEKQRHIRNNGPNWVSKPYYERDIQKLSTVSVPLAEVELGKLYAFLAAYERLERYKAEAAKTKVEIEKKVQDAARRSTVILARINALEAQLRLLNPLIERMRQPPQMATVKDYFLTRDVSAEYRRDFPVPDAGIQDKINHLHQDFLNYFPAYQNPRSESIFIGQRIQEWESLRAQKLRELDLKQAGAAAADQTIQTLRTVTLPMLDLELNRLYDFRWIYEHPNQTAQDFTQQIAQKENERAGLETQLAGQRQSNAEIVEFIRRQTEFLKLPTQEQVLSWMQPANVTVKDVVRWHSERFKQDLAGKEKDELLELVVTELVSKPTCYPLWLQYMIVHFSGMRYQSAHGSWADPKDLLMALCALDVQKELRGIVDEDTIEALCEQKYLCYQSARSGSPVLADGGDDPGDFPALARAAEPEWVEKIEGHLKALSPAGGYYKRYALLHARIDEEEYVISKYGDSQALDALSDWRPPRLPEWLWNEIVRVTELRATEVNRPDWEMVSADELAARYARGMGMYRDILNEWKRKNLTAWREAHDRTDRLIVSRAVCNEVAEHIQHIRGITPPGGLTAKPEWYMHTEKEALQEGAAGLDQPYFRKMLEPRFLKPGASLFWTRWMNKQPNQWQITLPFVLLNGEEIIDPRPNSDGTCSVEKSGSVYLRKLTQRSRDEFGNPVETTSTQWLRWMHEATIITVDETVDGPTVLTFETALPVDDRRQATIGVFKHTLAELVHRVTASLMNGTFVGYIPEGTIPLDHLREMLDWNHILQREAYPPEHIAEYWRQISPPISFGLEMMELSEECRMEVVPALSEGHWQSTQCFDRTLDGEGVTIYQPEVALRRGARLFVNKAKAIGSLGQRYYPVTHCTAQPRAQSLLVRADEVIDVTTRRSTRPVRTRGRVDLYHITGLDRRGRPRFEPTGGCLVSGVTLRGSTIHPVPAQERRAFLLISVCPRDPDAEGLFVRSADVEKMLEREYRKLAKEQLSRGRSTP